MNCELMSMFGSMQVKEWLEQLLWEQQGVEILRAKGVLNIHGSDQSHMLQVKNMVYTSNFHLRAFCPGK